MSLEDEIQDRFVVSSESILEENLDRIEGLFDLYEDGTIAIGSDYRESEPDVRIIIYLIGQRFAMEGGITEGDTLQSEYFYEKIDRSERTIREYLQEHRDRGLVAKEGQSNHRIVVENLPAALDLIKQSENQ